MPEDIIYNSTTEQMKNMEEFLGQKPQVEVTEELITDLDSIPKKMAFKIGEVAELLKVKPHVLRYWETEFEVLKPKKSQNSQRIYLRQNVELAMMIKKLLYKDRFSIEGAKAALKRIKTETRKIQTIKKNSIKKFEKAQDKTKALIESIRSIRAKRYL